MDSQELNPQQKLDALGAMEQALIGLNARTRAISNNIANINTPHYKKQTVHFEEELQKALSGTNGNKRLSDIPLDKTHEKHLGNKVREITDLDASSDIKESNHFLNGNNINIDQEMIELTKTGLKYKGVANMTKKYFENMRGIIRGA